VANKLKPFFRKRQAALVPAPTPVPQNPASPATYYWGTVSNDWNTASWSVSPGAGPYNLGPPTTGDDAVFNAASTAPCTIGSTGSCRSLVMTGAAGILAGSGNLTIAGRNGSNVSLVLSGTITFGGTLIFTATSGVGTITTAGATTPSYYFNGSGGQWTLQDTLTGTGAAGLQIDLGTLDINSKSLTMNSFVSNSGSSVRSILNPGSNWALTGTGTVWNTSLNTGLTATWPNFIDHTNSSATACAWAGNGTTGTASDFNPGITAHRRTAGSGSLTLSGNFGNINVSAATSLTTLIGSATVTGNWLGSVGLTSGVALVMSPPGSNTANFTPGNTTASYGLTIQASTLATVQLQAASTFSQLILNSGTLDLRSVAITANSFASSGFATRAVINPGATWTINGTGTTWDTSISSGLTAAWPTTVNFNDSSATAQTWKGNPSYSFGLGSEDFLATTTFKRSAGSGTLSIVNPSYLGSLDFTGYSGTASGTVFLPGTFTGTLPAALVINFIRVYTVATSSSVSVLKVFQRTLAVATTSAVTLLRVAAKLLSVSTSSNPVRIVSIAKALVVGTSSSITAIKAVSKILSASTSSATSIITRLIRGVVVSFTTTSTVARTLSVQKILGVATSSLPLVARSIGKNLAAATISAVGSAANKKWALALSAVTSSAVSVLASKIRLVTLLIGTASSVAIVRSAAKQLAVVTSSAAVSTKLASKLLAVSTSSAAGRVAAVGKILAVTTFGSVAVVVVKAFLRTLTVATSSAATVGRAVNRIFPVATFSVVVVSRLIAKVFVAGTSSSVSSTRNVSKLLVVLTGSSVSFTRLIAKAFAVSTASVVSVVRSIGKRVAVSTSSSLTVLAAKLKFLLLSMTTGSSVILTTGKIHGLLLSVFTTSTIAANKTVGKLLFIGVASFVSSVLSRLKVFYVDVLSEIRVVSVAADSSRIVDVPAVGNATPVPVSAGQVVDTSAAANVVLVSGVSNIVSVSASSNTVSVPVDASRLIATESNNNTPETPV